MHELRPRACIVDSAYPLQVCSSMLLEEFGERLYAGMCTEALHIFIRLSER